jgi:hypothetical protein
MKGLWGLVRMVITARASKDGQNDAAKSLPAPIGQQKGQEQFGRYAPWGVDYRVPDGARALCVAPEGGSQICSVGARHDNYTPDYEDDKWSFVLYNEVSGTTIKLRTDGGVQISGKDSLIELKADGTLNVNNASGATIEMKAAGVISFNGGTLDVNRVGDSVVMGGNFRTYLDMLSAATHVPPYVGDAIGSTASGNPKVKA